MGTSSAHSEMNHPLEESVSLLSQQKHLDDLLHREVHVLSPEKCFFLGFLRTAPTMRSQRMRGPSCRMGSLWLSTGTHTYALWWLRYSITPHSWRSTMYQFQASFKKENSVGRKYHVVNRGRRSARRGLCAKAAAWDTRLCNSTGRIR